MMLPNNILYRTFFIRGSEYGTAFTIEVNGEEFLITASHLLSPGGSQNIRVFHANKWHDFDCSLVGAGVGEIDIAVLKMPDPVRLADANFSLVTKFGNCHVGQDLFFIGFPYKMYIDYGPAFPGQPCPFLKRGTLSAYDVGPGLIYVDAHNNEGFSGAPLYFVPPQNLAVPQVIGVVSKFKIERETVMSADGEPTDMSVAYNTGFLVAYSIDHALKIIGRV
jgi:hypothetical protein